MRSFHTRTPGDMGYQPYSADALAWHKHFAWWPVKVHGQRAWLKTVYRKQGKIRVSFGTISPRAWTYGTIFDVLSETIVLSNEEKTAVSLDQKGCKVEIDELWPLPS